MQGFCRKKHKCAPMQTHRRFTDISAHSHRENLDPQHGIAYPLQVCSHVYAMDIDIDTKDVLKYGSINKDPDCIACHPPIRITYKRIIMQTRLECKFGIRNAT